LGMWEESIASNTAARKAAHDQDDVGEELHAMDYLIYADLQLGRGQEAAQVLDDLRKIKDLSPKYFKVAYAASAMPARYAIERRKWDEAAELAPMPDALPQAAALTAWSRAVGFARTGRSVHRSAPLRRRGLPFQRCRKRESGNVESPDAADISEKAAPATPLLFSDSSELSQSEEQWPEAPARKRSDTRRQRDFVRQARPSLRYND